VKSRFTKGHTPYKVVYSEAYSDIAEAKQRELYIKKYRNLASFLKSRVPQNQ
jgi:predicted GIY-YIG superfamily endonuclease